MSNSIAIELKNVTKTINGKNIIDNISFDVFDGDILALIGPNGAGKTTIIKAILNLISTNNIGKILIDNIPLLSNFKENIRKIGAIVEKPTLYEHLSGMKNINIFSNMYDNIDKEHIKNLIDIFELTKSINNKVSTYSLGMKQRLALIIALIHKPKILILDEPTNGLDPSGILELRKYLKQLNKSTGITIMISSHLLSEMELICNKAVMVKDGKVIKLLSLKEEDFKNKNHLVIKVLTNKDMQKLINFSNTKKYNVDNIDYENNEIIISIQSENITNSKIISDISAQEIEIVSVNYKTKSLEDYYLNELEGRCVNE